MESEAVITKHRLLAIVRLSLELAVLAVCWCIAHLVCCLPKRGGRDVVPNVPGSYLSGRPNDRLAKNIP